MADITPLIRSDVNVIQSYGEQFKVSGEIFSGPILISQDVVRQWSIKSLDEESPVTIADGLLSGCPEETEIVLCGTGKTLQFPPKEVRAVLKELPFNIEYMDTGAACRTYNILMAEGRQVVAALLPH